MAGAAKRCAGFPHARSSPLPEYKRSSSTLAVARGGCNAPYREWLTGCVLAGCHHGAGRPV